MRFDEKISFLSEWLAKIIGAEGTPTDDPQTGRASCCCLRRVSQTDRRQALTCAVSDHTTNPCMSLQPLLTPAKLDVRPPWATHKTCHIWQTSSRENQLGLFLSYSSLFLSLFPHLDGDILVPVTHLFFYFLFSPVAH